MLDDAIVPYWHGVATADLPDDPPPNSPDFTDFAQIQEAMTKVVFSHTADTRGDVILSGDVAPQLFALKERSDQDIILSAVP